VNATIIYDLLPTPQGALLLIARDGTLVGVHFDGARYAPAIGAEWRHAPGDRLLAAARRELGEYFAGTRRAFDLPLAPMGTPFQRAVWQAIAAVPYGETISYRELAQRVGRPAAVRAAYPSHQEHVVRSLGTSDRGASKEVTVRSWPT